jgi:hypothetical protein
MLNWVPKGYLLQRSGTVRLADHQDSRSAAGGKNS